MEIKALVPSDFLWQELIAYAASCSWKAGPFLARDMENGHFTEWERVFAALAYAGELGFPRVYLVSGEKGLYEKYGFRKIDEKKDAWGNDEQIFMIEL